MRRDTYTANTAKPVSSMNYEELLVWQGKLVKREERELATYKAVSLLTASLMGECRERLRLTMWELEV